MKASDVVPVGTRFRVVGGGKYFPSVALLPDRPGIRWSDGSGDDESMQKHHMMVVNNAPDPRGLAKDHGYTTMASCIALAHAFALMPEMLDFIREEATPPAMPRPPRAERARAILEKLDAVVLP